MDNGWLYVPDEAAMRALGSRWARQWTAGEVVLLEGELGAGKTTLVRGILEGLSHLGPVRSPTFNLMQAFATVPPVLHADLYRVASAKGLGLEDYLETHLCLIEWPDRALDLLDPAECWRVQIVPEGAGRCVRLVAPGQELLAAEPKT